MDPSPVAVPHGPPPQRRHRVRHGGARPGGVGVHTRHRADDRRRRHRGADHHRLALPPAPRGRRRVLVLGRVRTTLGRRAREPGRPVRPAGGDLRATPAPGFRHARRAPDRPTRVAIVVGPRAHPGVARVPAHHRREPRDARAVDRGDGLPVAATHARDAARDPVVARRLDAHAQRRVPRDVGRAAARGRGRGRRRRGRQRRTRRQGVRPGGPGARPPRRCVRTPLRLAQPAGAAPGPVQPGAPGHPRVRTGRGARVRGLARAGRPHHPRDLPRLLDVPRAARRAGADARGTVRRGAAGPGGWRADPRHPRRQHPHRGGPRCGRAPRRARRRAVRARAVRLHAQHSGPRRLRPPRPPG